MCTQGIQVILPYSLNKISKRFATELDDMEEQNFVRFEPEKGYLVHFLPLARGKLKLCSANHRPGYWSNLPCDWPSKAWAYWTSLIVTALIRCTAHLGVVLFRLLGKSSNGKEISLQCSVQTFQMMVQVRFLSWAFLWLHNGRDGVSNHQPNDCSLNRSFRRRSKKTSKLQVTGLCVGNSPVTGEFPAQMASNAENVSIWWRLHGKRDMAIH